MPENMTDAFAAYADALTPERAPDYSGVTRAVRRRRRRQASAGVTVTVAAVVVAGAVLTRAEHGARTATVAQPSTPHASVTQQTTSAGLPVTPEVYAWLRAAAVRMATGNGDPHPTRLEAVAVADVNAADTAVSGGNNSRPVKRAGYVIEIAGHFVCGSCSVPAGAQAPSGTVANATLLAGNFTGIEFSLNKRWVDLTTLGHAFDLTPAGSYVPDMAAHPDRTAAGLPSATTVNYEQISAPPGWRVTASPSMTSRDNVQAGEAVLSAARAPGGTALTGQSQPIAALAYLTTDAPGGISSKHWVWLIELTETLLPDTTGSATATGSTLAWVIDATSGSATATGTKLGSIVWVIDATTGDYLTSGTF